MTFWKKQIASVYSPCLIWSIPLFALSLYLESRQMIPINIFYFLFCGFSIYYFIALIIQCYLLLPYISFNKRTLAITGCLSAISILIVTFRTKIFESDIPLLFYAAPFPVLIVFFAMGGGNILKHKNLQNNSPYYSHDCRTCNASA